MKTTILAACAAALLTGSAGAQFVFVDDFNGPTGTGGFNDRQFLWQTFTGNGYVESEGIIVTNYALELYGTMQFEIRRPSSIFPQTRVTLKAREYVTTGATTVKFIGMTGDFTMPVPMSGGYEIIDSFPATILTGDIIRVELFSPSYAHFDDITVHVDCQNNGATTDIDADGFITGLDFDWFVFFFMRGDLRADFDRDGFVSGIDYDCYVWAFEMGCP